MALLFLRFGLTAVGGPAAHIALIERECVLRRQWISRGEFADVLAVSSLIPGPTSTELATAQQMVQVDVEDVFAYFVRMGSLVFGSGSVLPVLEGDLVERLGWLTPRQLLDTVAAGQVTPGRFSPPVLTDGDAPHRDHSPAEATIPRCAFAG